jgi:hypothetical protein
MEWGWMGCYCYDSHYHYWQRGVAMELEVGKTKSAVVMLKGSVRL